MAALADSSVGPCCGPQRPGRPGPRGDSAMEGPGSSYRHGDRARAARARRRARVTGSPGPAGDVISFGAVRARGPSPARSDCSHAGPPDASRDPLWRVHWQVGAARQPGTVRGGLGGRPAASAAATAIIAAAAAGDALPGARGTRRKAGVKREGGTRREGLAGGELGGGGPGEGEGGSEPEGREPPDSEARGGRDSGSG